MRIDTSKRLCANIVCIALALMLAISLIPASSFTFETAYAETTNTNDEPDEFQSEIEASAQKYNEASKEAEELQKQIEENQTRIDEINEVVPVAQERADESMRELYDLNANYGAIINMILGVQSISDAINKYNYLDHIRSKNVEQIKSLSSMKEELDTLQADLSSKKEQADAKAAEAQAALEKAQNARAEAQRKAQEKAAAEKAKIEEEAKAEKKKQEEGKETVLVVDTNVTTPTEDEADWKSEKDVFVEEWTSRIDKYLQGSPLAGQGKTFAEAAWDYGVDPRWSPAISNTESSKGAYCFKSHNAWGWGSSSWDNWEDAIRAHVKGLANGYGYTISEAAAKKYCPPNWLHWYNATSAQMNKI
jgi:peptidoglycan DL-endopeptidase CwlO